jgi:hypothetical protein
MTVIIPLVAMIILLVAWAKMCPPIVEPVRYQQWVIPHARLTGITHQMDRVTLAMAAFAAAAEGTRVVLISYSEEEARRQFAAARTIAGSLHNQGRAVDVNVTDEGYEWLEQIFGHAETSPEPPSTP